MDVCHTLEECRQMYLNLSQEKKSRAINMLSLAFDDELKSKIRKAISEDPEGWISNHHFWWGMGVRNLLRDSGFGEEYFGVHNLDDIYVYLIEDAVNV